MHFRSVLIYYRPGQRAVSSLVRIFAEESGLRLIRPRTANELIALVNRTLPACVLIDETREAVELCHQLKGEPFTAIIPVIVHTRNAAAAVLPVLEAGADEVLTAIMSRREQKLRIQMTLERADRDVGVHPTTRLPGTAQIERDISERMRRGETFAVCYADLDHFKEFNDRYGYNHGDRVIYTLALILKDVVRARSPTGFIGHIGGDDFIFNVPAAEMPLCCEEILEIFDELVPYQYRPEDRHAGYFLGKDRRGNNYRVPIMTLSIGVVTNVRRRFTHTARVSELATEMKSYAKTLPGSVYAVDRRSDPPQPRRELPDSAPDVVEAVSEWS